MKAVEAFTDGACRGNPGPGGWGVVLRAGGRVKELSGGEPATTNNRMELTSRDRGARRPQEGRASVDLYTDSVYVRSGITQWLPAWRARGWRTADTKPVKNQDLWVALAGRRRAPRRLVALGQGSRGSSRERARRRAREPRAQTRCAERLVTQ